MMGKLSEILQLDLSKNPLEHASTYLLSKLTSKDLRINIDENKNIYVTKGHATFPAFVASISRDRQHTGVIVERTIKNVWVGYQKGSSNDVRPADFAAGVKTAMYLGLKLLEKLDNVKCVFKITDKVSTMFFDDCRWALELNGKGNNEILTAAAMMPQCSNSFRIFLKTVGKKYGFEPAGSGMPSVSMLNLPVCVVNVPNGHYAPYSGFHQVVEGDVTKALHFCQDMAEKVICVCLVDAGCGTCGKRLALSEEHFCYTCLNNLRKTKMVCSKCSGTLYTSKEFYTKFCTKCK